MSCVYSARAASAQRAANNRDRNGMRIGMHAMLFSANLRFSYRMLACDEPDAVKHALPRRAWGASRLSQLGDAFGTALQLVTSLDRELAEIVLLSLEISLSAVAFAAVIGMPVGAALALARFPGR